MRISIIGSGNMARGIGTRLASVDHELVVHGRDSDKARDLAEALGATHATDLAAAANADVIVLATPYQASLTLARELADALDGRILVDISNPLNATYDGLLTTDVSAAEQIALAAPAARVVKAFNTTFAGTLIEGGVGGQALDVLLAGDDDDAKAVVAGLVEEGGLVAIDAGPLHRSRQLEGMALLGITLQFRLGTGFGTAWKLVRP
ncbi:MAG: NADPH-dependent F420 reductase [Myxococcales bacterium]|nr:NADPH-dependent F420 reductase [Myxococcales bacterium]